MGAAHLEKHQILPVERSRTSDSRMGPACSYGAPAVEPAPCPGTGGWFLYLPDPFTPKHLKMERRGPKGHSCASTTSPGLKAAGGRTRTSESQVTHCGDLLDLPQLNLL